jgi:hypothetical protein
MLLGPAGCQHSLPFLRRQAAGPRAGYQYTFPFLDLPALGLSTADGHVAPLYEHMWPIHQAPTLSFIGLPWKVRRCPPAAGLGLPACGRAWVARLPTAVRLPPGFET